MRLRCSWGSRQKPSAQPLGRPKKGRVLLETWDPMQFHVPEPRPPLHSNCSGTEESGSQGHSSHLPSWSGHCQPAPGPTATADDHRCWMTTD